MVKKLVLVIVAVVALLSFSVPAFAYDGLDDVFTSSYQSSSQFLVTILRPEGDESTYRRSYVISGSAMEDGLAVRLYVKDGSGYYTPLTNTEGESSWEIGSSGLFMKEVALPYDYNSIRVVAYRKYDTSFYTDYNLQVSDFNITVLNESLKETFRSGTFKIDIFDILKPNS